MIVHCKQQELVFRCEQRGYSITEVMPCVVAQNGDEWTVDVEHPQYPRQPKPGFEPPQPEPSPPSHGPGKELHGLLGRFGLTASGDCKCNSRASLMDAKGCDWCEANINEIVGWLRESAEERGLPFLDLPARLLVRRAIANARKAEARRAKEAEAAAAEGPAA